MSVMLSGVSWPPSACANTGMMIPGFTFGACDSQSMSHWSVEPAAAFAAQMAALNGHDCASRIGAVRVPTLVLAASDDIIIRPELSRRLYDALAPGVGTWAEVPGGHAAFWEDPGPWNQAVIDFVRAHSAP